MITFRGSWINFYELIITNTSVMNCRPRNELCVKSLDTDNESLTGTPVLRVGQFDLAKGGAYVMCVVETKMRNVYKITFIIPVLPAS